MGRVYLFVDESGDLSFKRTTKRGPTRYFILTTVTTTDESIGVQLSNLRRQLAWNEAVDLPGYFHVTDDQQIVRDRVFAVLSQHHFQIHSTIYAKRHAFQHIRDDDLYFYKLAWYLHLKHVTPNVVGEVDELYVVAASMHTKKKRRAFYSAVQSVVRQVSPTTNFKTVYWSASSEPCLQVADYCSWAIHRKWERGDSRSYDLIKDKIRSEHAIWGIDEVSS